MKIETSKMKADWAVYKTHIIDQTKEVYTTICGRQLGFEWESEHIDSIAGLAICKICKRKFEKSNQNLSK